MKLDEWHAIRDALLAKESPLRLDCMNPFRALSSWRLGTDVEETSREELLEAFAQRYSLSSDTLILTKGVRSFLKTLMHSAFGQKASWVLPSDVYPAYREYAQEASVSYSEISTWPSFSIPEARKESRAVVLLLPIPHSPTGCVLSTEEEARLIAWLQTSSSHYLFLDCVYAYDPLVPALLHTLEAYASQVFSVFSLSKTWLQRCLAGCAQVPENLYHDLKQLSEVPSAEESFLSVTCFKEQAGLAAYQADCFKKQWQKFLPLLQEIAPEWVAPYSGYLAAIQIDWESLLKQHGILGIPPALFGSNLRDYTIITCLHDIEAEYGPISDLS